MKIREKRKSADVHKAEAASGDADECEITVLDEADAGDEMDTTEPAVSKPDTSADNTGTIAAKDPVNDSDVTGDSRMKASDGTDTSPGVKAEEQTASAAEGVASFKPAAPDVEMSTGVEAVTNEDSVPSSVTTEEVDRATESKEVGSAKPVTEPAAGGDGAEGAAEAEDVSFADVLNEPEAEAAAAVSRSAVQEKQAAESAGQAAGEPAADSTEPAAGSTEKTESESKVPADAEPITEYSSVELPEHGPKNRPDADTAAADDKGEGEKPGKPAAPKKPALTELEKLWKPVKDNPADFTAWTLLIQYAENQCFMEEVRKVLDAFLERYPYCYGYWKKYADLEKKRGSAELCEAVFARGLEAIPLSVDLWLHYIGYMREKCGDLKEPVRAAFQRAVKNCGLEFRSDRLWEQYASWEALNKEPVKTLAVYRQALAVPTLSYRTHYENLELFVRETMPQDLLTVEEFLSARRAMLEELKSEAVPAAPEKEPATGDELLPPGCDEAPPGVPALPVLSQDEECAKLRERILEPLRKVHKDNEKQVALRWNYEQAIKRPYFHVKPLERGQLKNWKEYLDFEVEQGDKPRIDVLFERCLIACACYEEFWLKYIRYLESLDPVDPDRIRSVYRRACWVHLPAKPAIHMLWATFEEKQEDLEAAAEVVERLGRSVDLLDVTQRRINLARRRGRLELAESLYADTLKGCTHREQAVTMAIKFVRFLYKVRDDRGKAEEVLREAITQDPGNQRLYLQLIDLGFQSRPVDTQLVQEAFRLALDAPMETRERLLFAHRRVEFLEEFGHDIQSLQSAQEEYFVLARALKAESKRRKQEDETEDKSKSTASAAPAAKRPSPNDQNSSAPEKRSRTDSAPTSRAGGDSGRNIPTITQTPARPAKQAAATYPNVPSAAPHNGYTQPPPAYPPGPGPYQSPYYQQPGPGPWGQPQYYQPHYGQYQQYQQYPGYYPYQQ